MNVQPTPATDVVDRDNLRRTLGAFATGITVVTVGGEAPHGMTANSFTAVSLDPPLVLVCVERDAIMHGSLLASGRFGVSVLASHQEAVARHFADRRRPLGIAQFAAVDWFAGHATAAPLITGAVAHFECELWQTYAGGDHTIFVGALLSMGRETHLNALVFLHGKFHPSNGSAVTGRPDPVAGAPIPSVAYESREAIP